jgi:hypothetical protein
VETSEKIARNNTVFRDANDEIESAAADHALGRECPVPFICECSDGRCTQIVRLTLEEYRQVRGNPRWFVHAPGHETSVAGAVETRAQNERYVVVEKIGSAGALAARLAQQPADAASDHG